jgi:hypothetical protein
MYSFPRAYFLFLHLFNPHSFLLSSSIFHPIFFFPIIPVYYYPALSLHLLPPSSPTLCPLSSSSRKSHFPPWFAFPSSLSPIFSLSSSLLVFSFSALHLPFFVSSLLSPSSSPPLPPYSLCFFHSSFYIHIIFLPTSPFFTPPHSFPSSFFSIPSPYLLPTFSLLRIPSPFPLFLSAHFPLSFSLLAILPSVCSILTFSSSHNFSVSYPPALLLSIFVFFLSLRFPSASLSPTPCSLFYIFCAFFLYSSPIARSFLPHPLLPPPRFPFFLLPLPFFLHPSFLLNASSLLPPYCTL